MTRAPVPDPKARPLGSKELAADAPFPDEGPLEDTGEAEIDIEREAAGVKPERGTDTPPVAELPPD